MQKADSPQDKWRNVVFFLTACLVAIADQLSKLWIRSVPEGHSLFELGFFQLAHFPPNTGAAFGLFRGQSFALTIIAFIGIAVLLLYALSVYRRLPFFNNRLAQIAIGLVLGGTVGNLIDRLRFGGVTDFIDVGFWPAFNIADSAITVGVIIFAYSLCFLARVGKH